MPPQPRALRWHCGDDSAIYATDALVSRVGTIILIEVDEGRDRLGRELVVPVTGALLGRHGRVGTLR